MCIRDRAEFSEAPIEYDLVFELTLENCGHVRACSAVTFSIQLVPRPSDRREWSATVLGRLPCATSFQRVPNGSDPVSYTHLATKDITITGDGDITEDGLTFSMSGFDKLASDSTFAGYADAISAAVADTDVTKGIDVSTQASANQAISTINDAINTVSSERSKLGAIQNRLEHTIANLATSTENLTAAESRIRDVDIAVEMMEFTKYQILSQASTAMLAQANAKPQAVLQLLR